jgi:protein SCO1/2
MPRRLFHALALAAAALLLAACGGEQTPQFRNTDITGADYGKGFELTDHTGRPRTLEDFRGKVVTIFFGFTQCPDVCPSSLATMAEVMRQLGPDADRVQVVFITIDPERDTQELLAHYMPNFHPSFLGLYGDAQQTAAVAREFKVFYQKSGDTSGMNYTMDHSAGTYVFDPEGRLRLYVRHAESAENIAADLKLLLDGR